MGDLWEKFEKLCEQYGLEKIKTNGNAKKAVISF
jgi:hypothetical protein